MSPEVNQNVVVVGAGLAGAAAALAAAECGAHVHLLEKQPQPGGSSVLSGGGFAFAGTDNQQEVGIDVLREDLRRCADGVGDPDLIEAYVEHQHETYRWLADHGVLFSSLQVGSGNSRPRVLRTDPHQALADSSMSRQVACGSRSGLSWSAFRVR